MKHGILFLLWLVITSDCLAGWKYRVNYTGGVTISYEKGEEGAENLSKLIGELKKSGNIRLINRMKFPDFAHDDDYQKRIKEALLKVSPDEAKKIFQTKEFKSWKYYDKLQSKLGDAYSTLEEFKDLQIELKKIGFVMGYVQCEKFSYSTFLSKNNESRLFGIHPTAVISAYIPEISSCSKLGFNISGGKAIEKNNRLYLKFRCRPYDGSTVKLKGRWSPPIDGYTLSNGEIYQHDGSAWKQMQSIDTKEGNLLTFRRRGLDEFYLPINKKIVGNYIVVVKVGTKKVHSKILSK